jgi:hypothetical protein
MLPTRVEEGILVYVYDDKDSNVRTESAGSSRDVDAP